ncbi:D-alanyl-D-alanine carboxypeptidase family protein [uncultured Clostridium sp.]|uniref:M15 family metallopeptidase n=1 Tax=uncultured Clostridium sp. TaxID=59620 RepID=UPI002615D169|nr:D-alanyl-D-alanine carboxypeptidase family protein [uncultured Clostridium sp.]
MNNIFKNSGAMLAIELSIVVAVSGGLINSRKEIIKKDKENVAIESREVLLSNTEHENLENKTQESNYMEIQRLESMLNNQYFILINKENRLSENYVPDNLIEISSRFLNYAEDDNLESTASEALNRMFNAAMEDGISLIGVSGYRSYDMQRRLYDTRMMREGEAQTRSYTAEAGASEHQTGLAIDILSDEYSVLDEGFENTRAFKWLNENCYKYGFILRYLKGKEDITGYNYEPWHFRYIGNEEAAMEIMNRGLTFEEYINEIKGKIENLKNMVK